MPRPVKKELNHPEGVYTITTTGTSYGWNECCSAWESWLPTEEALKNIILDFDPDGFRTSVEYSEAVAKAISERLRG